MDSVEQYILCTIVIKRIKDEKLREFVKRVDEICSKYTVLRKNSAFGDGKGYFQIKGTKDAIDKLKDEPDVVNIVRDETFMIVH